MMHEGLFRVMREVCFEDDVELLRGLADLLRHLAMFCMHNILIHSCIIPVPSSSAVIL
jgi:hypothetical protein